MYTHYLALRELKSYLIHRGLGPYFRITLNLFTSDLPPEEIAGKILGQEGDIAAFSVYPWNVASITGVYPLLKRSRRPVFIALGGPYVTFTAEAWMEDGLVDLIVMGEGEASFFQVANRLKADEYDFREIPNLIFRLGGNTIATERAYDFDVTRQDYPLLVDDGHAETFIYESSRGCPFECRYCTWDSSGKRHMRFYPKQKIEGDLEAIFSLPHVTNLLLCDSDLFLNRRHGLWLLRCAHRLNTERKNRGLPEICLAFETNPEQVDNEIIEEIENLPMRGNTITLGLQTLDAQVNKIHLNRPFREQKYLRNLKYLHGRLKKNNLISVEIIYGLPGETYAGFRRTVERLVSEMPTLFIMYFPFLVLPGSYFWDHRADYDLIYEKDPPHYLISSNTFSEKDMHRAKRTAFFMLMFATFLRGIGRVVAKNIAQDRMQVYEKIMDHITENYRDFVSVFFPLFETHGESSMIFIMEEEVKSGKYLEMRYKMVNAAREIVRHQVSYPPGAVSPEERLG
jgi:radical SAM superfamily enzyme YgiQ (UPF0313 family)